jgi:SAM-dependent methyltransferase
MKNKEVFNAYSRYYDLLNSDKDYDAEVEYIQNLLSNNGISNGNLLEFGSGTGKHGRLLAAKGYKVHGIERSMEMVGLATQSEGFTCQHGDICEIHLDRKFDAVLALFHVISYQTSNKNLNNVFARASEHLEKEGLFIFDFWYSPAVYFQGPSIRVKKMEDSKIQITRIAEPKIYPNENRVDVKFSITIQDMNGKDINTFVENHPMRHFSLPELNLMAEWYGFETVGTEEYLTKKPIGADTWGVCITLRKR